MRLFVSIEPPREIKAFLEEIIGKLVRLNRRVHIKWCTNENLHITLLFIGEVEEPAVREIMEALQGVSSGLTHFYLELKGLLLLPTRERPHVVGVSLYDQSGTLSEARQLVTGSLGRFLEEVPKERFKPHITLGRLKSGKNITIARNIMVSGFFPVTAIHLVQSIRTPSGSNYTIIKTFPLLA